MSLISKDFRLNQQAPRKGGTIRLRWALLAIVFTGIGVVIAHTKTEANTESKNSAQSTARSAKSSSEIIATDALPPFKGVASTSDDKARDSFSLNLPKLQSSKLKNAKLQNPKTQIQRQKQTPKLQVQQQIFDQASKVVIETPATQSPIQPPTLSAITSNQQWRDFKVKPGDSLARLFKRANIKPQQLDELMKSGESAKTFASSMIIFCEMPASCAARNNDDSITPLECAWRVSI